MESQSIQYLEYILVLINDLNIDFFMEMDFLIKKHWSIIKVHCYKFYPKDPDLGKMFFSHILEKLWVNRDKFEYRHDQGFIAFVKTICHNEFINTSRKKINKKECNQDLSVAFYVSDNGFHVDEKIFLDDVIFTAEKFLPERLLSVFRYHIIGGNTIEDTAKFLKIPTGTVKNRAHCVRKFLSDKNNIFSKDSFLLNDRNIKKRIRLAKRP